MIRNSLSPSSAAQAFMLVASSATKGVNFQRRRADGDASVGTLGQPDDRAALGQAPARRQHDSPRTSRPTATAGRSSASDTFAMGTMVLTSAWPSRATSAGTNATATFDHVTVTGRIRRTTRRRPSSLTSPAHGRHFTAPASIALAASASDSDGTVARVDFYNGTTLIGTATAAPYAVDLEQRPGWQLQPDGDGHRQRRRDHDVGAGRFTVSAGEPAADRLADESGQRRDIHRAGHRQRWPPRRATPTARSPRWISSPAPHSSARRTARAIHLHVDQRAPRAPIASPRVATDNLGAATTSARCRSPSATRPRRCPAAGTTATSARCPFPGSASYSARHVHA